MANWKMKVDFSELWEKKKKNEITTQELSVEVVKGLNKLKNGFILTKGLKNELVTIIDGFDFLSVDNSATIDDFDYWLERLYDWGDTEIEPVGHFPKNKLCWINTIK